jgi:hypothetical protein
MPYEPNFCGTNAKYQINVREPDDADSFSELTCGGHLKPTLEILSDETATVPEGEGDFPFPVILVDPADGLKCGFNLNPPPTEDDLP